MKDNARRKFVKTTTALGCSWVVGCGGGESGAAQSGSTATGASPIDPGQPPSAPTAPDPGPAAPPTSPLPAEPPLAPAPSGKFRNSQRFLFQPVRSKLIKKRLPEGQDYLWDIYGPTHTYVDFHTGWRWSRGGGDWLDLDQVRHGTRPWFAVSLDKALGNTAVAAYTGDVTVALQFVQSANRWCAFLLDSKNAARKMAGLFSDQHAPPSIDVTYSDGRTARLACRLVASRSGGSIAPATTSGEYVLPVFIEFERPAAEVKAAKFSFVITEHWSGANPSLQGFVLDPPLAPASGPTGIATTAGRLDEGIDAHPAVIGAHRYLDGRPLSDFVHDGERNYSAERNFDPAIFGNGPTDTSKFPHAGLGKWVNADPSWSVVPSSYAGEGFEPLAPGVGALRIHMAADPTVKDGSLVGYGGTLAGNGMIFLPEPLFGVLGRLFVRYYFRLGTPYAPTADRRFHVYNGPGAADWTTQAGKWGISPDHSTTYGGVSGSAGGGYGWQMRLLWADCDAGSAGPNEGGWATGFHLYDFNYRNPPGHNYGSSQTSAEERWGQRGGAAHALRRAMVLRRNRAETQYRPGTGRGLLARRRITRLDRWATRL